MALAAPGLRRRQPIAADLRLQPGRASRSGPSEARDRRGRCRHLPARWEARTHRGGRHLVSLRPRTGWQPGRRRDGDRFAVGSATAGRAAGVTAGVPGRSPSPRTVGLRRSTCRFRARRARAGAGGAAGGSRPGDAGPDGDRGRAARDAPRRAALRWPPGGRLRAGCAGAEPPATAELACAVLRRAAGRRPAQLAGAASGSGRPEPVRSGCAEGLRGRALWPVRLEASRVRHRQRPVARQD